MKGGESKMKKILLVAIALCFVTSLALAQEAKQPVAASPAAATTDTVVFNGVVIDNMCAGANKDTLANFITTHTKECALKPGCIDSGYSIYVDGKLYAFDKDSNAKVGEFLKKADSKLQVTITAKQVGDKLSLVSIENQK